MRTWLLIVAAVLLPTLGSSANYSIRNPAIRNPVGIGTYPGSRFGSSLIRTPSPIDSTGNLLITGNVRGGKSFQAPVHYNSTTEFESDLGTSTLNSFLRDTTGSPDLGRYPQRYGTRPYYSQTQTVTTTVPGRPGVFGPGGSRIRTLAPQQRRRLDTHLFALEPLPMQHIASGRGLTMTDADLRGLRSRYDLPSDLLSISDGTFIGDTSPGLRDVGRLTVGEAAMRRQDEKLATQRLSEQTLFDAGRELRVADRQTPTYGARLGLEAGTSAQSAADARNRAAARYRLSPLETSTPIADSSLLQDAARPKRAIEPYLPTIPGAQDSFLSSQIEGVTAEPGGAFLPPGDLPSRAAPGAEHDDVMERIREQLDDLAKSVESRLKGEPGAGQAGIARPAQKPYEVRSETRPYVPGYRETLRPYEPMRAESGPGKEMLAPARTAGTFGVVDYRGQTGFESQNRRSLEVSREMISLPGRLSTLSPAEMSGQASRIMGSHGSIDSLSDDKFNRHMQAAEAYLRAGKYYKASDSFALASIYRPGNAHALAGRSHALFAAGEYMSSALFLSRALAIRPDLAKARIDLVTLLGDRSRLAGRIADVERWFARSGSGKLQLLLGYVYLQTGRLNEATKAIEAAYTKIPQSPAIPAIKAAIDAARR